MHRMHPSLLAAVVSAILAGAAHAQAKPAPAVPGAQEPQEPQADAKTVARQKALEAAKSKPAPRATTSKLDMSKLKTGAEGPPRARNVTVPPEDAHLSPDEVRAKYKDRLGAAFVDYKTHCEPATLAPGERGKIVVYFVLKNDAVMLSAGAKPVEFQTAQGDLTLGPVQIQPAGTSRIAAAFRGKTAYDDFVVAEIPVAVGAGAADGLQTVHVTFDYELYNGTTAGWIEKFRDHVTADVRIAKAAAPAEPTVQPAATGGAGAESVGKTQQTIAADGTAGQDGAAAGAAGAEAAGLEADGSPLYWALGAAGAVLGAAALLRLRRR